jgi:hypothetical protein
MKQATPTSGNHKNINVSLICNDHNSNERKHDFFARRAWRSGVKLTETQSQHFFFDRFETHGTSKNNQFLALNHEWIIKEVQTEN